ncbi:hypothetical protein QBC42DRAFT_33622 [Cladorrhinum samala]|uniref:Uncharacterized protein n=1 Tax=Cladorrhinum samala TaxID=585594 RepID=A0AAV9HW28_9PEZI|nr:hypothetical protein QBC42DRAFT_33622 [Cladorrhinum samala]
MQFKNVIAVLAAGLSVAYAEDDLTTTQTSTLTQTQFVTITQCNPTNTACPGYVSSATTSTVSTTTSTVTTWSFPLSNSTANAGPTASSQYTLSTAPVVTQTSVVDAPGGETTGAPIQTGAAAGLFFQPAVLLGALGAAAALLA